jgi:subtilisin family serine protease
VTDFFYPAGFDNVVSVAAFDEDHRRPAFSNYGNWVDISAPGNVIMSAYPLVQCGGGSTTPGDTGCYNWSTGTSMATPHVSGAAALVWSRSDVSSNSEVVDILLQSADPRGVDTVRLDTWTIHGGLNLHDALSFGLANQPPVANAGADQTMVDSDDNGSESVTLDGSSSSDPDGSIVSYEWVEGTTVLGSGATLNVTLPVGTHVLTLSVRDNDDASDTDTVVVTIDPASPPGDTVVITKATYNTRRRQLAVEATSTDAPAATLTAYDNSNPASPVPIGSLSYNSKKRKYSATFNWPTRPTSVLVLSSSGGSATSAVQ